MSPVEQLYKQETVQNIPEFNQNEIKPGATGGNMSDIESEKGVSKQVIAPYTESSNSSNYQEQSAEQLYKGTVENTYMPPLSNTNEFGRVLAGKATNFSVDITAIHQK